MVGPPLRVLAEEPFQFGAVKEAALVPPEQELLGARAQLLAKPAVEGDAETALRAGERLGGEVGREGAFERLLSARERGR